jgi:hypothetical protein
MDGEAMTTGASTLSSPSVFQRRGLVVVGVRLLLGLIAAATIGSAILTLSGERGAGARALAVLGQVGMTAVFIFGATRGTGGWCSPGGIVAIAWLLLFTVPSAAYAIDPTLLKLPYGPSTLTVDTLQIVNLALAATLLGWIAATRRAPGDRLGSAPALAVARFRVRPAWCVALGTLGALAVAAMIAHAGGVTAYLTNVDRTAGTNAGLTYVLGVAMCLKFAAGMPLLSSWSRCAPGSRLALCGFVLADVGVGVLLGARGLILVGFAQFFILRSLIWRAPTRRVVVPLLLVSAMVVFGFGAMKRYVSYRHQHPGTTLSLPGYLRTRAPREVVDAYVNNYVDSVRLIAMVRSLVPSQAGYEPRYQFLHVVLHPIPSSIRPAINRNPRIAQVLVPGGGTAYAVPLIGSVFLGFGVYGVAIVSLLVGWLTGRLDLLLGRGRRRGATFAVAFACVATGMPLVLRSGLPEGLAFAALDVVVGAIVARLALVRVDGEAAG